MSNTPYPDRPHPKPVGKRPIPAFFGNLWRQSVVAFAWPLTSAIVWVASRVSMPKWMGSDLREFAVRLWSLAWLAFVWVLLWGDVTWGNVVIGIVFGVAVLAILPLPRVPVEGRLHPLAALNLLISMLWNFLISAAQVAWAAVRPGEPPLGCVVRVHLAIKSDLVLTLAVDYLNLVPGTMVVEIDHVHRILYVHVFDVRTQKQVDHFRKQMAYVERQFIRAFERDSEWHPSPYHGIDDDYHHVPFADRQRVADGERAPRRRRRRRKERRRS
ncbi:Na(+)/H(+) antiporter subunit E [Gordonia hirsuta DSM 44140 = NBRC 16056]|uniref:Na(+)/H(+) antiporter subunit E n=1 Tax=Gordonia hirsuta DSM 44140 = NBRC 16056 TaxID=1121927 RepID=L7L793_9ACTN|nr:Na+/H+ antiporter subunit E [Gordonia hirsuta]GAC56995.1 Na(+)/H(+) antiporter subunit E [Gordonia hirsuta DSM 44140 = NBRC 16056]